MVKNWKYILASASPRRRELLTGLGLEYEVRLIDGIDESYDNKLCGEDIPIEISKKKAAAYISSISDQELVITADTIVYLDGEVLGKPKDMEEAKDMLHRLSGKVHQVITGVTFLTQSHQHSFASTSNVQFADLSNEEIDYYIKNFRPMDKAGAYGIQEWIGFIGVERIEGSYFNVMGLPVQRLYKELQKFIKQIQ